MSCTTDSRSAGRRGSILMEFVIVLPFYLLLLGVAVLLGDFALRSIWLTQGDVLVAYAAGDDVKGVKMYLWNDLFKMGETYTYEGGAKMPLDMVTSDEKVVLADSKFEGAWSYQVAGTATDRYALPPWARGWLGYSEWTYRTQSGGGKDPEGPVFSALLAGSGEGRYSIVSRDLAQAGGEREFGYYTLMRSRQGRAAESPYRRWTPAELSATDDDGSLLPAVGDRWYKKVFDEPFPLPNKKDKKHLAEHLEDEETATVEFKDKLGNRGDFPRGTFIELLSQ